MISHSELPIIESMPAEFFCPEDPRPISRSLHLARLAAGYDGCRRCEHRHQTGSLPKQVVEKTHSKINRASTPLITSEGVRGLSVNQLTRERISRIAEHVLNLVDTDRTQGLIEDAVRHGPLRILTGYDSRTTSPDLAIGMVTTLRRWGCEIADTGRVSRPEFDFHFARLRPHLGMFITGGNSPHAWNGLDLIDHAGLPWTLPGQLTRLESLLSQSPARRGRTQGPYAAVNLKLDYQSTLTQQFHAIRPLRLAVACPDLLIRENLKQLLEETSCSVLLLPTTEDIQRNCQLLTDSLCDRRLDAGFLIGTDGRSCRLFDEGGYELTLREMLELLSLGFSTESPTPFILQSNGPNVANEESVASEISIPGSEADLLRTQRERKIPLAADESHRFWFLSETPACDAIQTLARILEVLSLSEKPVSAYRQRRPRTRLSRH